MSSHLHWHNQLGVPLSGAMDTRITATTCSCPVHLPLAGSQGNGSQGVLDKGCLPLLNLGFSSAHPRLDVLLELGLDLDGLHLALRGGIADFPGKSCLRGLAVLGHSCRRLLPRLADLLRVGNLDLVSLGEHVRGLGECLQELRVSFVHLLGHWCVPERVENRHHRQEGDGDEGQGQAKVEHPTGMRWLWHICQQHRRAGSKQRLRQLWRLG
mmetsp:Transcript_20451/g.46629  ORF Transcript_20451/g.46629 Transcript_20451/m.46629 type:complete len:212 (-) Transcript_20451:183-818(-)